MVKYLVVSTKGLTKVYGKHTAVDNVSLHIKRGEIYGFIGRNGAGKTTTFRMILGLLEPTEGSITWKGKKIDYSASSLIGYLPEERGLFSKIKTSEQLIYLARLRGMSRADAIKEAKGWLERFNVPEYYDKKVGDLSKGNQQKIQFIASVIHKPELLILDEPFNALDVDGVECIRRLIVDLRDQGVTILMTSHYQEDIAVLCDYVYHMENGSITSVVPNTTA